MATTPTGSVPTGMDRHHEAEGPAEPMSRASQISDRKRIEALFREMFGGETGLSDSAAEMLAQRCASRIKRIVVWEDGHAVERSDASRTSADAEPVANDVPATPPEPPATMAAFDPYAFSAVVVLTKSGKDGLLKRLAAIDRPEHLKKLAEAQHLAVDASLSSAAEIRDAIVKAAEQRIANRRAAAS